MTAQFAQQAKDRGLALVQQGRLADARLEFQKAVQLQPDDTDARNNLAVVLIHLQRYGEAALHFQQVLRTRPELVEAHIGLGVCLQRELKRDEAVACYRQALQLAPGHVKAQNNLGVALMEMNRLEEAATSFEQAVKAKPDHVDSHVNLGIVRMKQGRLDESAACYRKALDLAPNLVDALGGLGAVLTIQGHLSEAMIYFEQALRLNPHHADAHLNRAVILLLQGQWEKGWVEYEWRWRTKTFAAHALPQPRWDGSELAGRTILLQAEQGLGDTLHFIRYAPLVKERGGKVILQCEPSLVRLLTGVQGIDSLVTRGSPIPPFDVYAPLVSLAGIFHTTPTTIPATIPYLHGNAQLVSQWRGELSSVKGLKVGIAWHGSPSHAANHFRSFPLAKFAPLAKIKGVQLISLQKGPGAEQLAALGTQFSVQDLGYRLDATAGPFMDTAAVMKNLDLVIACDTATAHLAGALGVPVWVALSVTPDWRWLLERADTPWYPTMRLFRQKRLGDWDDVFQQMTTQLQSLAQSHAK
ncbi:MAG TPA: tetratricopeptide repeat protein [Gemmataceae bacterium]|nr:tetratricopeptide repeat protein [Gemmataceae bacterium]